MRGRLGGERRVCGSGCVVRVEAWHVSELDERQNTFSEWVRGKEGGKGSEGEVEVDDG